LYISSKGFFCILYLLSKILYALIFCACRTARYIILLLDSDLAYLKVLS
jgi:hypothetical protein